MFRNESRLRQDYESKRANHIFGSRSMRLDLSRAPTDENDLSCESKDFDSLLLS